jgi:5'-nucleotidase
MRRMLRLESTRRRRAAPLLALCALLLWSGWWLAAAPTARAQGRPPYRILLTNDDGVRAAGLLALAEALRPVGEVTIVAPLENQSAKSQSLSITDPIYADEVELPGGFQAIALAATPASCVKVALGALLAVRPDLVVSGINRGYNLGMTTYISGTVGAAREAALEGVPAIAASLQASGHPHYAAAAQAVRQLVELVKTHGLARGVFLNVNVPAGPADALRGLRLARQSPQMGVETYVERRTPAGRRYFWSVYRDPAGDAEGTDLWAVEHGYVAVTPLRAGEFDAATFDRWQALVGR